MRSAGLLRWLARGRIRSGRRRTRPHGTHFPWKADQHGVHFPGWHARCNCRRQEHLSHSGHQLRGQLPGGGFACHLGLPEVAGAGAGQVAQVRVDEKVSRWRLGFDSTAALGVCVQHPGRVSRRHRPAMGRHVDGHHELCTCLPGCANGASGSDSSVSSCSTLRIATGEMMPGTAPEAHIATPTLLRSRNTGCSSARRVSGKLLLPDSRIHTTSFR